MPYKNGPHIFMPVVTHRPHAKISLCALCGKSSDSAEAKARYLSDTEEACPNHIHLTETNPYARR